MKTLIMFVLFTMFAVYINAQDVRIHTYDPPLPYMNDWAGDIVVSNSEPAGRPSCFYKQSGSVIYASVPDTNILANNCLVILQSTNNGLSWSIVTSVSPAAVVPKTKLVGKTGSDTVYCVYQIGNTVYVIQVGTSNTGIFTNYNVRDFDAAVSSTNSLYLIVDVLGNNEVRFFGTVNGGQTWGGAVFLSSVAAFPTMYMSGSGDTCLINYYGVSIASDTISSAIRSVRYRENTPGALVIAGTFTTPIAAGVPKDQFKGVKNENFAWLFYTSGETGSKNLNCIASTDGGTTFQAPITIGEMPGRDEYWFDARHSNTGVDLIYYSDTLQTGPPTSLTDRLYYSYALNTAPGTFTGFTQINNYPVEWSDRKYIPTVMEFYNTANDAAAIYVGLDGTRKLYFDRKDAMTGISSSASAPAGYVLRQNYPNPFNPVTTISYEILSPGNVSLTVYDVLGKEVANLINAYQNSGIYEAVFNAGSLSSGVYFYKLAVNEFSDVKSMVVIK